MGPWSERILWAEAGLVEELKKDGFTVIPDRPKEKTRYGGGYIVRTYGKNEAVEAWQLEHGRDLRFEKSRNRRFVRIVVERLARSLPNQAE